MNDVYTALQSIRLFFPDGSINYFTFFIVFLLFLGFYMLLIKRTKLGLIYPGLVLFLIVVWVIQFVYD